MCLAVPMRITELLDQGSGVCELESVSCNVDLSLIEDPRVGEFVIVHAGFAIERLDTDEADTRLKLFQELARLQGSGPLEPS